jgi:segregation and condensation protein A
MIVETSALPVENANQSLLAVAKVAGENWQNLPDDLYIPPNALEVFVDIFEGPLDLLLYLIKKQNLDILNIPVAQITRQYMEYVELMQQLHLELAGEYLLMAALLTEIKSRMLLPRSAEVAAEEEDPRAALVAKLKEYEQIKKAAEALDKLPRQERDIFPPQLELGELVIERRYPPVEIAEMLFALQDVLKRAEQFSQHQITKETLSLKDRMISVLERLKNNDTLSFFSLFSGKEGRAGVVVAFLAILELSKEGIIEIFQAEPFAEILVRNLLKES